MTTPNIANSSIALSEINGELNFPTTTPRNINDMILRELSGVQSKTVTGSPINFSDLSSKTAFGGLSVASTSNTASDFGSVAPTLTFNTTTDLVDPVITWTTSVVSGWQDVSVIKNGTKSITLRLNLSNPGTATANVLVGVSVSYAGHLIGQANQYVTLSGTVYDPMLSFTGNTNVNTQGFVAQTATTTLTAFSNSVTNTSIAFNVVPTTGVTISGNSVIFSVQAANVTVDNTVVYSVDTNVLYRGSVIATNNQLVTVRAVYNGADFNFVVPATTNNQFANSGAVDSSLTVKASHNIPGANVVWSYSKTAGTDATFTIDPSNANSTITLSVAAGTFTMLKGIYNVTATLQYANGYVLNTKTTQLTLRAGTYGLNVNPGANIALSGYQAQTALSVSSFSWGAGNFDLAYSLQSGTTAEVSKVTSGNNTSLSIKEYANTMGAVSAGTYTLIPTITFDGLLISNTAITQTVAASYLPYTFNVIGSTSNTQIGTGTVNSTLLLVGSHNIPNGSVSWVSSNPNITMSANTSAAALSISTTTINNQTSTITATLRDDTGRTVTNRTFPVTLRAYAPNVVFTGSDTVSVSGYAANQVALASIAASCSVPGANTFGITPVKVSGNDLNITNYTGNTSTDQVSLEISAAAGTIGTKTGTYQLQATVGYFDATFIATENITVSATTLDPQFTLTANGQVVGGYNPPVVANGTVASTFIVPNGKINWSYTGGVPTSFSSTNTAFSFINSQSSVGYSNINLSVTGTLVDANNLFVASKTVLVNTSAQFIAATPTLTGATAVSVSNLFSTSAGTTLTASVVAGVSGQTYRFITSLVSGSAPTISSDANSITLSLGYAGIGSASSVIDVTCNVIIGGTIVGTSTKRVTLSASCPAPAMNSIASSAAASGYTYPVNSLGRVDASMPDGGYVVVSYALTSGNSLSVATSPSYTSPSASGSVNLGAGGSLYFGAQTNAVGTISGTYNITNQFYAPSGQLLKTTTGTLNVSTTRKNPNFSFGYTTPSTMINTGWVSDGTLQAIVGLQAINNSDIPNINYQFNAVLNSGSPANFNYNNINGQCNVQLVASDNTPKTSNYSVSCTLLSGSQVIAGPISLAAQVGVTPYYINVASVVNDNETDQYTSSYIEFTSNHPQWGVSNVAFTASLVGGNRIPSISTTSIGSSVYWIMQYNPQPPAKGTYTCSYNVTPQIAGHNGSTQNVTMKCVIINPVGTCVVENMYMDSAFTARDVIEGMVFDTWTPEDGFNVDFVNAVSGPHMVPCVRLESESGAVLECTFNTRFNLRTSKKDLEDSKYAMDMENEFVLVNIYGERFWEKITKVTPIGNQPVMQLDFGGKSYAAGAHPSKRIFSHNMKPVTPIE